MWEDFVSAYRLLLPKLPDCGKRRLSLNTFTINDISLYSYDNRKDAIAPISATIHMVSNV